MNKLRLGVDVDGILADFNPAYKKLIEENSPIRLPDISDTYPNTWSYEKAAGCSPTDINKVWTIIKSSDEFWENLTAYQDAEEFLDNLWKLVEEKPWIDVYFITSRPGQTAKTQTEGWLNSHMFYNPTVLISSDKELCASALNLTHYIDDKNENCTEVRDYALNTKCYMLARPWNQPQDGIPRLKALNEFYEIIKGEAHG
jgi:hypothetical protein